MVELEAENIRCVNFVVTFTRGLFDRQLGYDSENV